MAKVRAVEVPESERRQLLGELELLFESCRSAEEIRCLIRTLHSSDERVMLARRVRIARQLLAGRTQHEIAGELRVGPDTIYRVGQSLARDPSTYHLLVERARRQEARRQRQTSQRQAFRFSWPDFRRRYPLHFWPVELVTEVEELVQSYVNRRRQSRGVGERRSRV